MITIQLLKDYSGAIWEVDCRNWEANYKTMSGEHVRDA